MARERERVNLGPGISLYQEFKVWLLDATYNGHRVRRSLGTRNRYIALKWAIKILENEAPGFFQEDVENKLKIAVNSLNPDIQLTVKQAVEEGFLQGKSAPRSVTIQKALEEYVVYQQGTKRNSKAHVANVRNQIRKFLASFPGVENIADVRASHVSEYLASCASGNQSAKTCKDKLGIISAWLAWAKDVAEYIPNNAAAKIHAPKVARQDVIFLGADEALKALKAVEGDVVEPVVATALYAGLRREELAQLEVSDISLEKRVLRVRNKANWSTKTRRSRSVPILDQLLPYLVRLPKSGGAVFRAEQGGDWTKNVDRLGERVREMLEPKLGRGKATLQVLRHTFCTHLRMNGVEAYAAAKWAGHSPAVQERCYAGYELGEQPLKMTFHGLPLERHGTPPLPTSRSSSHG